MNSSFLKSVKYEIPRLQQVELELCQINREDKAMERLLDSMLARFVFWEKKIATVKRKSDEKKAKNWTKPLITVTFIDGKFENGVEVKVQDDHHYAPIHTLDEPALDHVHTIDEPVVPVYTIDEPVHVPVYTIDEPVHAPVHTIDEPVQAPVHTIDEPGHAWTGMEPEVEAAILHLFESREKSRFIFVN